MRGWFVTATGTGVGKTFVTRGLATALRRRGHPVAAIKPVETGCAPDPLDARALARACGRPELASAPGLYRAPPPVAPYAATLSGLPAPPPPDHLAATVRALAPDTDITLVEGAGGLLVPLDRERTMADLARALGLPLLLVADDGLGVLSFTLTAADAARARGLDVAAVVLVRREASPADPSRETNGRILAERLAPVPVLQFPHCADEDRALADAAEAAGLLALV
ncbi:MAG: dethiobiotin synthase [Myxococcota bacterium]